MGEEGVRPISRFVPTLLYLKSGDDEQKEKCYHTTITEAGGSIGGGRT